MWNRSLLFFFLTASLALSQLDRGQIVGSITDPSGAIVPGARVSATQKATGIVFSASATTTGAYTLAALPVGIYDLEVEATGFKRMQQTGLEVNAGSSIRVDIALDLGSTGESVQVHAEVVHLETDSARSATNITNKLVQDLPLVVGGRVRSVFDLAILAPETRTGNRFRIGGGQGASFDMLMDGTSVSAASNNYQTERAPLSAVSVDAISEFSVESVGMKAEFGRAMGILNFVTKSGSNDLHGNLYEFLRNDALDARGFFAASRPILRQHNFGGTVGGPVYIPKIYDGRNRTFFFFSYEGFRSRTGSQPTYMTIPLPEMYQGDFRNWTNAAGATIPIYDPATTRRNDDGSVTRDLFPNNQIPASRFSQVANNFISFVPAEMTPNVAGPRNNYMRQSGAMTYPWNKFSVKADHQLSTKDHVSFLLLRGKWEDLAVDNNAPGMPYPFNDRQTWNRQNSSTRLTWNRTLTPTILNSFRFSYMWEKGDVTIVTALDPNAEWGKKLGIKNSAPEDRGVPRIGFTEYTPWSGLGFGFDQGRNLHFADDVSIQRGNHTFKSGFFLQYDRWDGGGQHRNNGSFDFSNLATGRPGDQTLNSGNAFASFLLGYAGGAGLETRRNVIQKWKYWGGYFQDDWRISPKLTLNLGLRYEYTRPVRGGAEVPGQDPGFSNFSPTASNPGAGGLPGATVFSGVGEGRTGQASPFNGWPWAVSPRLGVAWQARPGTVVRMHAGRSFAAVKTTGGSTNYDGFIGNFSWASSDLQIFDFPTMLDAGIPHWNQPPFLRPEVANGQAALDYWQVDAAGRPSEYWTWGLDIQHQLPFRSVFTIGYTGTKGTHLTSGLLNYNQLSPDVLQRYSPALLRSNINSPEAVQAGIPLPYPGFNGTVQRALQQYPQYQMIRSYNGGEKIGNSTYHAMVLKIDKRYSSGLTLLGSYVLSKMFSNAEGAALTAAYAMDHYNRGLEKSISMDDQTHIMRFSTSYELPIGRGKAIDTRGIFGHIVGNWALAGFLEYSSGTPLSVAPGINPQIYPTGGSNRATITSYDNWRAEPGEGGFDPFRDLWWDKSAFQNQPTQVLETVLGNATRNNPKARSPWFLNENVNLAKDFVARERIRITLRFEAFNLFNRVRWGGPSSTFTANTFGQVRSQSNTPRQAQVALKFQF